MKAFYEAYIKPFIEILATPKAAQKYFKPHTQKSFLLLWKIKKISPKHLLNSQSNQQMDKHSKPTSSSANHQSSINVDTHRMGFVFVHFLCSNYIDWLQIFQSINLPWSSLTLNSPTRHSPWIRLPIVRKNIETNLQFFSISFSISNVTGTSI